LHVRSGIGLRASAGPIWAARFDISVAALIYLNAGLQVLGDDQRLFEGTTLNLDPAAV
jgi:hypothetical protein